MKQRRVILVNKKELLAWAIMPTKNKMISDVLDFGLNVYRNKKTAMEKLCPNYKIVKVRILEVY